MKHLVWDLGFFATGARFEVELQGSTARVCLMDGDNYQAYLDRDEYYAYGDYTEVTPVVVEVPYDDYWYLVVDSNPRRVRASCVQVFD